MSVRLLSVLSTGQGLNTALEDAAELAWWLREEGLTPEALRYFEKERLPRMATIAYRENVRNRCLGVDLGVV